MPLETVAWMERIATLVAAIDKRTVEISARLEGMATRAEVEERIDLRLRAELAAHGEICDLRRRLELQETTAKRKKSDPPPPAPQVAAGDPVGGLLKNLELPVAIRWALLLGVLAGGFVTGLIAGR